MGHRGLGEYVRDGLLGSIWHVLFSVNSATIKDVGKGKEAVFTGTGPVRDAMKRDFARDASGFRYKAMMDNDENAGFFY